MKTLTHVRLTFRPSEGSYEKKRDRARNQRSCLLAQEVDKNASREGQKKAMQKVRGQMRKLIVIEQCHADGKEQYFA